MLGGDALRALLIKGHKRQAEYVEELEVASSLGYLPLYNVMSITTLNLDLLKEGQVDARKKLSELVPKLEEESFLCLPTAQDIVQSYHYQLLDDVAVDEEVPYVDVIGLVMAMRLQTAYLTKEKDVATFIARIAPDVQLPPFHQTLKLTRKEGEPM